VQVVWFRYLRFTPAGRFLYKTSPHRLGLVYKALQGLRSNPHEMVYSGRCSLKDDQVRLLRTSLFVRLTVRVNTIESWIHWGYENMTNQ
jgi:hypothetical protein